MVLMERGVVRMRMAGVRCGLRASPCSAQDFAWSLIFLQLTGRPKLVFRVAPASLHPDSLRAPLGLGWAHRWRRFV